MPLPMPMPMPGGAPPMPGAPPGGTGPAAAPGPMPGNQAQAMSKVQIAMKALQEALPGVPMGTPLHHEILTSLSKLGKHLPEAAGHGAGDPQAMIQQLAALAREARANPGQEAALAGMMPPGAHPPGAPPPGAPPMAA